METEAQVAESQELRHSSPATAPTNGSLERESEAESLEDEAAAATPKTVTPGLALVNWHHSPVSNPFICEPAKNYRNFSPN